eukprot:g18802.t1
MRKLAQLQDRLLFIWLQQHLHQDNGPTLHVAAILTQMKGIKLDLDLLDPDEREQRTAQDEKPEQPEEGSAGTSEDEKAKPEVESDNFVREVDHVEPVSCAQLADDPVYKNANGECYNKNVEFNRAANCNAPQVLRHAAPEHPFRSGVDADAGQYSANLGSLHWACFAVPGTERLEKNAYERPGAISDGTTRNPNAFFGSADRKSPVHFQSCCMPPHGGAHEKLLVEEERFRNAKTAVEYAGDKVSKDFMNHVSQRHIKFVPTFPMHDMFPKKIVKCSDVDVFGKLMKSGDSVDGGWWTDYQVLVQEPNNGYFRPALVGTYPNLTAAVYPIADAAKKFLTEIKNGDYDTEIKSQEHGDLRDQTGIALMRLLDGAIYERRQAIKKLYSPDRNAKIRSVSKWKTPDYPVVMVGATGWEHNGEFGKVQPARLIKLNDGNTTLRYKATGLPVVFPAELPALAGPDRPLISPESGEELQSNQPSSHDGESVKFKMPHDAYLISPWETPPKVDLEDFQKPLGPWPPPDSRNTPASMSTTTTQAPAPVPCRDLIKAATRTSKDEQGKGMCYDPNLTPDWDAICDMTGLGVLSGTWACWAAPGSESLGANAYDGGTGTSVDPPLFFGSADRSKSGPRWLPATINGDLPDPQGGDNWKAGWYQSCCYPPKDGPHESGLIEQERLRAVKRRVDYGSKESIVRRIF